MHSTYKSLTRFYLPNIYIDAVIDTPHFNESFVVHLKQSELGFGPIAL